jgi:cysteine desulfurase
MKNIYLDNNATTQTAGEVIEEMLPYLTEYYGNASSMHSFGGQLRHKIDQARQQVADLLGCNANEIIFTSGGTESDNAAIRGVLECESSKRHIVTTRVEHPAVQDTCRQLQKQGLYLTELPVDNFGRLELDELSKAITDDTAMVSVMYANNETGVVFPIEDIARIVKNKGCVFHTDAVQAAGKIPINLNELPADLLSISGHKLHGPKGVGVLYIRRGTKLSPLITGGHQEWGRRAGTENVPAIIGLGKACELAQKNMYEENNRVKEMRDRLENALTRRCPDSSINGDRQSRLPNTTNISFEYIEGEAILLMLNRLGIAASSGSACTSGSLEPSHVLRAMGVPFTAVHGSIRFSLSRYNTDEEIDYVIRELPGMIERLREISPFSKKTEGSTR